MLIATIPRPERRASIGATACAPGFGNPIAFISARSRGSRHTRGRGFPGCATAVIVPTSTNPNPRLPSPSNAVACLSRPAATPSGESNVQPERVHAQRRVGLGSRQPRGERQRAGAEQVRALGVDAREHAGIEGAVHGRVSLDVVLRLRLALLAAVLVVAAALVFVLQSGDPDPDVPVIPTPPGAQRGEAVADPFAYSAERAPELTRRAARGTSRLLYTRSPGGAAETAKRVAEFREPVEAAAKAAGVNPDLLEALVFLESAGRPDVLAPGGIEGAAGLTQILAETGQNLLDMDIDLERSRSYTRRLDAAVRDGNLQRAAALTRARRRVDDRFDPAKALAGTARYLKLGLEEFDGREDLAFVSYHMGMGNLNNVIKAFGGGPRPYVELYFDSTPQRHQAAQELLTSFGDDSSNYYWKLLAARDIMRAHRKDPAALDRTAAIRAADASGRERLLAGAEQGGTRTFEAAPENTGLEVPTGLELRPEALAVALYMGSQVRSILGDGTLRVQSAADGGWSFRIARTYASEEQALAFQYVLDRLQVLDVIAWSRAERTIRVTAGRDAEVLEPLLDRLG